MSGETATTATATIERRRDARIARTSSTSAAAPHSAIVHLNDVANGPGSRRATRKSGGAGAGGGARPSRGPGGGRAPGGGAGGRGRGAPPRGGAPGGGARETGPRRSARRGPGAPPAAAEEVAPADRPEREADDRREQGL